MQWNCPHCGTALAIADNVLGKGWSFSRCYKCGGFALIRRAEVNIIKVDKAPPGENVILPEAPGGPTGGLMSETASNNYIKAALNRAKQTEPTPPAPPTSLRNPATAPSAPLATQTPFPAPLPETPLPRAHLKPISMGIAATAILAVASGIYFFIQWQSLWERAREANSKSVSTPSVSSSENSTGVNSVPTIIEAKKSEIVTNHVLPTIAEARKAEVITDHVQQTATAPIKPPSPLALTVQVKVRKASIHSGPGIDYPTVGTVNQNEHYIVGDLRDRWLRLPMGWIRNDLVQVLSGQK